MQSAIPSSPAQSPIRIVLVDDHPEARSGMRSLISSQPDMVVVGDAEDGESSLPLCATLRPDVAVLDLLMPGMDGLEAASGIARLSPATRVLLVSISVSPARKQLFQAGVLGFLSKSRIRRELLPAIRAAMGRTGPS